jgi:hypothetical protein
MYRRFLFSRSGFLCVISRFAIFLRKFDAAYYSTSTSIQQMTNCEHRYAKTATFP